MTSIPILDHYVKFREYIHRQYECLTRGNCIVLTNLRTPLWVQKFLGRLYNNWICSLTSFCMMLTNIQKAYDVETAPIYIIENVGIFEIRSLFQPTL